jgi:hypothetical protein
MTITQDDERSTTTTSPSVPFTDATAALWGRLARPFEVPIVAEALCGLRPAVVEAISAVRIGVSAEAEGLLGGMATLSRSLTTAVSSDAVRARGEVRGPVLWSETISARASSFGDDDLYICATPQRDYDTPANRALRQALRVLADAASTIDRAPRSWRDDPRVQRARVASRAALGWLEHPTLARVGSSRVTPREVVRVRAGKSAARYAPALALLEAAAEPLGPAELLVLCDRRTRLQHWVLRAVVHELESRGMVMPPFRVEGRALLSGPVTYAHDRHPIGDERLRGILVGNVLVDVAGRGGPARPPGSANAARRRRVRTSVGVRGYDDVQRAVDLAVLDARQGLAEG